MVRNLRQRTPRWLRVSEVRLFFALSAGVAYFVYDYATRPMILSLAVGSIDGGAVRLRNLTVRRLEYLIAQRRMTLQDGAGTRDAAIAPQTLAGA